MTFDIPEATSDGWDIKLMNQPPNSPDFNILDLGFFNSIQSLQQQKRMTDIDELITAVEESFWEQKRENLENFCSMMEEGGKRYKLPHIGKKKLRNRGILPQQITVSEEAINIALEKLGHI